jgi:hypothetical protein
MLTPIRNSRIDLHPEEEPEDETPELSQPPPQVVHHGSRLSRYLDIARGTSGDERMAALRQLREEERTRGRENRANRRSRIQSLRLGRALSRRGHSDT